MEHHRKTWGRTQVHVSIQYGIKAVSQIRGENGMCNNWFETTGQPFGKRSHWTYTSYV